MVQASERIEVFQTFPFLLKKDRLTVEPLKVVWEPVGVMRVTAFPAFKAAGSFSFAQRGSPASHLLPACFEGYYVLGPMQPLAELLAAIRPVERGIGPFCLP